MGNLLDIFSLLFFTYVLVYYYKYFTRPSPLPGPLPIPFVGNMLELFRTGGDFAKLSVIMHKKYGDMWEFHVFSGRQIWISRSNVVEKLFNKKLTRTHYFDRTTDWSGFHEIESDSQGLTFVRDYEKWRINRKFLSQALLTPKFKKSLLPTAQGVFAEMEEYWSHLDPKKPIDVVEWASRFSSEMIFKVSLHRDLKFTAEYFNTLVPDELKVPQLSQERFETGFVELTRLNIQAVLFFMMFPAWVRHYVPGFRNKNQYIVKKSYELFHRVETEIVQKRRAEIENTPMGQELTNDLLTQLCIMNTSRSDVKIENANGQCKPMTDYEICRIMTEVFVGGSDTTTHTLSYLVYYLFKQPHVKARLLQELEAVLGSNFNESITLEQLDKLSYLDAVVKETARLSPVVHGLQRITSFDDEIGGYIWPAGTVFAVDILNMNHHPSEWTEPEKFIPERWLKEDDKDNGPQKRVFTFGGGIRECPGRYLSVTESKIFIALFCMKYDFRLANENEELQTFSSFFVLQCKELKVFIKPKC